jgi:hypothetical protein
MVVQDPFMRAPNRSGHRLRGYRGALHISDRILIGADGEENEAGARQPSEGLHLHTHITLSLNARGARRLVLLSTSELLLPRV